jgi:hypothetical protein
MSVLPVEEVLWDGARAVEVAVHLDVRLPLTPHLGHVSSHCLLPWINIERSREERQGVVFVESRQLSMILKFMLNGRAGVCLLIQAS